MKEMYWISVVGNIGEVSQVMILFCGICILLFGSFSAIIDSGVSGFGDEIEERGARFLKKATKTSFIVGIISVFIAIFVPEEKQLYRIIGLGMTIEYIKDNEVVKQLPDKCIEALDQWAENIKGEKEDEE
jgi:hypothetical protein